MLETRRIGPMIAYWRNLRRMSQLALATEAEVSARHLSFIESGRANPSREMILILASALDVPLRERNTLLQAGGFAAAYRESALDAPQWTAVRAALDAILAQHRPYPAVVLDRCWNVLSSNDAAERFFDFLLAGGGAAALGPPNVLRLVFHPDGLRPRLANWEAVAEALIQRVHRESIGGALTDDLRAVLTEILGYPGVPARWSSPDYLASVLPIIPLQFERDDVRFSYFSAVTTLGTPIDVTAQELRIECMFPVDDETRRAAARLAGSPA
jgi:transcriptional regulator with XRE-family HTH domain